MQNLTTEELERIQGLVTSFNKLKISLGDTVIQQNKLMADISEMKIEYAKEEENLVKKYGEDAIINIQTGEIKKENG
jgi:hypothetical protein